MLGSEQRRRSQSLCPRISLSTKKCDLLFSFSVLERRLSQKTDLMSDRDLYSGMIRLHVLYHASQGPVFGFWIIEELGRHGYELSPGTLYPILHGLELKGLLRSTEKKEGQHTRIFYRATPAGRKALKSAKKSPRAYWRAL
jgi:PadR family transcriptional regulator PadR